MKHGLSRSAGLQPALGARGSSCCPVPRRAFRGVTEHRTSNIEHREAISKPCRSRGDEAQTSRKSETPHVVSYSFERTSRTSNNPPTPPRWFDVRCSMFDVAAPLTGRSSSSSFSFSSSIHVHRLWRAVQPQRVRMSCSPSPLPSPTGRGRTISRVATNQCAADGRTRSRRFPLSLGERAGVRGSGAGGMDQQPGQPALQTAHNPPIPFNPRPAL
jgi:hypothetical protein